MCFKPKGMKTRVLLCGKRLTQACRDRLRLSGTDPDSPPCISQLLHRDILFNIRKGLWGAGWGQPRQPLSPKPQPDSHLALLSGSWVSCAALACRPTTLRGGLSPHTGLDATLACLAVDPAGIQPPRPSPLRTQAQRMHLSL